MRAIILCVVLTITMPYIAAAQKVKKVTETSPGKFNPPKIVYEVLADSPHIRHGVYEQYGPNNRLYTKGFYNHGLKDSIWKTFYKGNTRSQKFYKNGQKTGIWEFWDYEGQLSFSFDFSRNQGKKYGKDKFPDTTAFYYQMPDGSWKTDPSVIPPVKLSTAENWQAFLVSNLRYPQEAIDNDIQGAVWMSVLVDENGDVIDYSISKSAGAPLDNEALRVIKLFQPEFVPAEKNGKKIKFRYEQPLVFRLESE